jgi:leucyl aminopeptidase
LRLKHHKKALTKKDTLVTHPVLQLVSGFQADNHLVCITDKHSFQQLSSTLTEAEFVFMEQGIAQKVKQYLFPRGKGSIIVKLVSTKDTPHEREEAIRMAGNDILALCSQYKFKAITINAYCETEVIYPFVEGMVLGNYAFVKYFSKEERRKPRLETINIIDSVMTPAQMQELRHITEAVYRSRSLVNEPFASMDTLILSEEIHAIAAESGFKVETLGKEQIQAMRMGGLLAVNQASNKPPHFHILEWKPADATNTNPIVLVGKGVVFDTGGLSLKPADGLETMKCDMAGAAAVVGAISAISKNKLPVHIIGLIPATDNVIGENAVAPGDVVRMYSGTTVEIVNTDAEGRLILADALHYAKKLSPSLVIDFATLTGAAVRALGSHAICYMGTANKEVKTMLEDSGLATYERLVELPLWAEYGDELKSNIADMKNLGSSYAGMITAGKFLEHFTAFPWLHLDIAGPAYLKSAQGYRTKDGTGVGVRLMYHFIKTNYCAS